MRNVRAFAGRDNMRLLGKLVVVALLMFGFGYALVPMYRAICDVLGINVLSLSEQRIATGMQRNSLLQIEAGTDRELYRTEAVADRVDPRDVVRQVIAAVPQPAVATREASGAAGAGNPPAPAAAPAPKV